MAKASSDSSATHFDLIVIGSGPGGYVAAIKAAQLGLKTACIEKDPTFGGTCLNVGCIPSKALLHSSHLYEEASVHFKDKGINVEGLSVDLKKMMANKDKCVGDLTKGVAFLFKKYGVTPLVGHGRFTGPKSVAVDTGKGEQTVYTADNIIIATGSEVAPLPGLEIDEERIVSSTGALDLPEIPGSMAVIGAGVIGLELGSVWTRLGSQVTVVEYLDRILPGMDGEVASSFEKIMKKQGLAFKTGHKAVSAKVSKKGAALEIENRSTGATETLKVDYVLVAIGRRPYTANLDLEAAGLAADERGRVPVNDHLMTAVDGVYAIGDVIVGPMLAHKAEEEGIAVVERIAGQKPHINYNAIPGIVYTHPEIAAVGKTEEELKEAGIDYKVGKFPFTANGRARTSGDTDGYVKLIADAKTDRLLGGHVISGDAGAIIHELTTIIEFGGSSEDIARSSHGHPTTSEAVKEAALAIQGNPIHM